MMQKFNSLLLLFFLSWYSLHAQHTAPYPLIGSFVDLQGQLIHEHADQDYAPFKSLQISFNPSVDYTPGVLYPALENSKKGQILYIPGQHFVHFRKSRSAKAERIALSPGLSMTVGADSFVVAKGFSVYGKLGIVNSAIQELQILQYLGKTDKFVFYQYNQRSGSPQFVVQIRNNEELVGLPHTQKALASVASGIFYDYPRLIELLDEKELKEETLVSLMRFIQFTDGVQSGRPIWYTNSWEITDNPKKMTYYAEVSQAEQNWKLDFFSNPRQKLFTVHFSFAQPVFKDGETIWYYPESGEVRKKTLFTNGEPSNLFHTFHRNGTPHYTYTITSFGRTIFKEVSSTEGNAILNHRGSGIEVFYDQTANRSITREYKNYLMTASWYTDNQNRKIYQLAKRNADIRSLKSTNTQLASLNRYPKSDILSGTEGIVLVKLLLTPENKVESYEILQSLSQSTDASIRGFISKLQFKSGKHGKEKVYQEMIVPFRFSLFRQSINRYNYNNLFWLNNQMHHQQMQLNNLPNPPSIPRF